jgi:hypothetical protein
MFANRYVIWMKSARLKSRLERSLPLCLLSVKKVARLVTLSVVRGLAQINADLTASDPRLSALIRVLPGFLEYRTAKAIFVALAV